MASPIPPARPPRGSPLGEGTERQAYLQLRQRSGRSALHDQSSSTVEEEDEMDQGGEGPVEFQNPWWMASRPRASTRAVAGPRAVGEGAEDDDDGE